VTSMCVLSVSGHCHI